MTAASLDTVLGDFSEEEKDEELRLATGLLQRFDLDHLTPTEQTELAEMLLVMIERHKGTAVSRYKPYPKQRKFHAAGGIPTVYERLLIAGNQLGKTLSAGSEVAYHLTGEYPDWWEGACWDYAPSGWAASETAQGTRDTVQRMLLGRPGEWGTGTIPQERIVDIKRAASAVPDCVDSITVRHKSGGLARLTFKTYDQGRSRWQGETLDFVWFDEEPPEDIYSEGKTRVNATDGIVFTTFTPLKGMSTVVKRFLREKPPGTFVVSMTTDDVGHYTPEQRARIVAGYPAHERQARARGIPVLGSGAIYPVSRDFLSCKPFPIPAYWPRIAGMDFGWTHPTAVGWLAWDRDNDVVYLYDTHRQSEQTPTVHAASIRARGKWIPVAWPHDGLQHEKGGGEPLAEQYRKQSCAMLPEHATHAPEPGQPEGTGGYSVEAGVIEMLSRMESGRFRVFEHLNDFWEEHALYRRDNGKIVKEDDDLLDAVRTGLMMLRYAKVQPRPRTANRAEVWRPSDPGAGF